MSLKAGIVGMPNVGKSTLYNALTSSSVLAENYPFATIEPNTGVVNVPDDRLDVLVAKFKSQKRIAATFEFTDIAGLVKGASKGEGLGNQFLAAIREVDAICHVVRCFDDSAIIHVDGSINPLRDIETINFELIFSDMDTVNKRLSRIAKKAETTKDAEAIFEYQILKKLLVLLERGQSARSGEFTKEEKYFINTSLHLLTMKPVIYIANVSEDDVVAPENNKYFTSVKNFAVGEGNDAIAISIKMEEEISRLEDNEKKEFIKDLGIEAPGLNRLINITYKTLGLRTFFTAGEMESRAWTFTDGSLAPACAGVIHTDFEKGFIRAEVYSYNDLVKYGSEAAVKENGKWRLEGKEYRFQDGDIAHFRFNVR